MLKIRTHAPRYTASVSVHDLPDEVCDAIRRHAVSTENMYDYADGDFYVVPDFSLLQRDTTPDDVVAKHLAGELSDDDYPEKGDAEDFDDLSTYLLWLQALRFIAANVPEGTLSEQKMAIYVSQ